MSVRFGGSARFAPVRFGPAKFGGFGEIIGSLATIAGLTDNPTYGLVAQIGELLTGAIPDLVGGEVIVHGWTLDGAVIAGATEQTYRPIVADELGVVRYAPTVDGVERFSQGFIARRVPPIAGTLAAVNETVGSGQPTVNLAAGFTGNGLRYTSDQPWATVPLTGSVLTILDELRDDTVAITATNSGGSVTVDLSVTIAKRAPAMIYVEATGNDSTGDGTAGAPFRQLAAASAISVPGDIITAGPGTYLPFAPANSGTAALPITYVFETGAEIEGDLQDHVALGGTGGIPGDSMRDGIYVNAKRHLVIRNPTISNVWRTGIFVIGGEAGAVYGDILLTGQTISNTGSSSISVQGINSDDAIPLGETQARIANVIIENFEVSASNIANDYITNPNVEAISVAAGAANIRTRFGIIRDTVQYGVDYKAGVYGGAIHDLDISNVELHAVYLDTGRRPVQDVDIYNINISNCRHGVVLAREQARPGETYAETLAALGAAEMVGELSNIDIWNITCSNIERSAIYLQKHPTKDGPSGTVSNIRIGYVSIYNARQVQGTDLNLFEWSELGIPITNVRIFGIVAFNSAGPVTLADPFTNQAGFTFEDNLIDGTDPQFANVNAAPLPDLRLVSGSPAEGIVDFVDAKFTLDGEGNTRTNPSAGGAYKGLSNDSVAPILKSFAVTAQNSSGITFNASVETGEASYTLYTVAVPNGETAPSASQIILGHKNDGSNAPLWVSGFTFLVDQTGTTVTFDRADEIAADVDWYAVVADPAPNPSNVLSQIGYAVDTEPPKFSSAATNVLGNQVTVTFDDDYVGTADSTKFSTSVGTISGISFSGPDAILTFPNNSITDTDTVTVSYSGGDLRDGLGNEVPDFTAEDVVNNVPGPSNSIVITNVAGGLKQWDGTSQLTHSYTYTAAEFVGGLVAGRQILFATGEDKRVQVARVNGTAATPLFVTSGGNGGRCSMFSYIIQAADVSAGSLVIEIDLDSADKDSTLTVFEYGDKAIVASAGTTIIGAAPEDLTASASQPINKYLVIAIGNFNQFLNSGFPDFGSATELFKENLRGQDSGTGFSYAVLESAPVGSNTITITGDPATTTRCGVVMVVIQ